MRRRLQPHERREEILREAIAFFSDVGVEGTTRDLSTRAKIAQPLIYKYFATKRDLIEAVYERIYLNSFKPHWPQLVGNGKRPIRERMTQFYIEYADSIIWREWVRIFVSAGLHGEDINRRYLKRLEETLLVPLTAEIGVAVRAVNGPKAVVPTLEDVWQTHGGVFYIGIREYIYGLPPTSDRPAAIAASVDRFLKNYKL